MEVRRHLGGVMWSDVVVGQQAWVGARWGDEWWTGYRCGQAGGAPPGSSLSQAQNPMTFEGSLGPILWPLRPGLLPRKERRLRSRHPKGERNGKRVKPSCKQVWSGGFHSPWLFPSESSFWSLCRASAGPWYSWDTPSKCLCCLFLPTRVTPSPQKRITQKHTHCREVCLG